MTTQCPKCKAENPDESKFCSECGTQLIVSEEIPAVTQTIEAPREELTTGATFAGRYQIIEELGRGGMGKVYRALDKKLNEEVALKLIKPEIASDRKTLERFQNELKLARKIRHSNVGGMYELLEDKSLHYITMEYVSGEDLKSLIRRVKQIPIVTAISITKQICNGLSEAHKLGVVHRDLKPSNIMIDKEGNARIMDFGIARSLEAKGITGAGVIIGTPEYMSPEQVEGKDIDHRSDIYSLGVILYEMVTGQVPFEGDTPLSVAHKHKYEAPQEPNKVNTQIPMDLNNVILRCLEKDRERRCQSAEELRSELGTIEKGIPTTEKKIPKRKPLTSKEVTVQFTFRKALFPLVGAVMLVMIALIIWRPWSQKEIISTPSDEPSLAILYFKNNTGDENLDHWRNMLSNLLITDLTQSKYIKVLSEARVYNILESLNQLDSDIYSSEVLKQLATEGGVNHILQGAYAKAGDEFRINVTVQEAISGEILGSDVVRGMGEESVFAMIDELTKKVKTRLGLSNQKIGSDIDEIVKGITTNSPEAYRLFVEGSRHFHKGRHLNAVPMLEKAIELDSEFAMAYRVLGRTYQYLGKNSVGKKYIKFAYQYSNKLPERERYLIRGDYYGESDSTLDNAINEYTKLIELYPTDPIGNVNLSTKYYRIEDWDKAIERCMAIFQHTGFDGHFSILAYSYCAKGMYEKAKEVLEFWLNNVRDSNYLRFCLALTYLIQSNYDLAFTEIDKIIIPEPVWWYSRELKSYIYRCLEELNKAVKAYEEYQNSEREIDHVYGFENLGSVYLSMGKIKASRDMYQRGIPIAEKLEERNRLANLHLALAYTQRGYGDLSKAIQECDKALTQANSGGSIVKEIQALHSKGLAFVQNQSLDEAQETADELKRVVENWLNKKLMRYYHHLTGMIELEKKNYSGAVEKFVLANSLLAHQCDLNDKHALFFNSLALAHYKSGEMDKAKSEYERIVALTTGRLNFGDIYAKSFYMLGRINEQQGDTAKAIEHYEKFLDLWKDADPGIAEMDDARERLAGLKGQ